MSNAFVNKSVNFEDVPVAISGSKRQNGYLENFQVEFDQDLTRVLSTYIENIQYLNSGYQFNDGNDKWLLRSSSDEMADLRIQEGTYTGEELANEITSRLSQDPFGIQGPDGFENRSLNQFPYECTYDNISRIFTIQGGFNTSFAGIFIAQNRLDASSSLFSSATLGSPISPLSPLVSFLGDDAPASSFSGTEFTVAQPDPDNLGEFIATSSFQANGDFVVKPQTRNFAISNFATNNPQIDVSVGPIAGTYFDVALAMQNALNAEADLENFQFTYNTNTFRFQLFNDEIFGVDIGIDPATDPRTFSVNGETDDFRNSYSYISTEEFHATAPTFTIAAGSEFNIDEGTAIVSNIITTELPEVTTATGLPELTVILQDAVNANTLLTNTYEITFSTRTARVRVKALRNAIGIFPTFGIMDDSAASAIYGFTVDTDVDNLIKKSDTAQFETGAALSLTVDAVLQYSNAVMPLGIYSPEEAATELTKAFNVAQNGPLDRVTSIICSPADGYSPTGTGDFFDIPTAGSAISRFWFNVSGGNVAPPADNRTLVAVAITTGDTAATVAGILSPIIDAVGGLDAVLRSSFDEVVLTQTGGSFVSPVAGKTAESQARMTFTVTQESTATFTLNPLLDEFVAEYNDELKTYVITRDDQIAGFSSSATIIAASMGSAKLLGFTQDFEISGTNTTATGDSVTILYGPLYLYIKSNRLSDQKISTNIVDAFYKNVIGKLQLIQPIGGTVFNDLANDRVNRLAVKTTVSTIDFRLVDEDGALYNTNGSDIAFTIVFERF